PRYGAAGEGAGDPPGAAALAPSRARPRKGRHARRILGWSPRPRAPPAARSGAALAPPRALRSLALAGGPRALVSLGAGPAPAGRSGVAGPARRPHGLPRLPALRSQCRGPAAAGKGGRRDGL